MRLNAPGGSLPPYWRLAFGEFALIFAGIIAALAADNWNTRRLEREEEVEALHEHLRQGLPYSDSLDSSFGAVWGFSESYLNRAPVKH